MSRYTSYYASYGSSPSHTENILDHLALIRWYKKSLAYNRLYLIAEHIDDPQWIKDKEEEWLYESGYWDAHPR